LQISRHSAASLGGHVFAGSVERFEPVPFRSETATFRMKCRTASSCAGADCADLQRLDGLAAVSTEAFEGAPDHDSLLFLQVERVIARPSA
jgi:hypothetical protein